MFSFRKSRIVRLRSITRGRAVTWRRAPVRSRDAFCWRSSPPHFAPWIHGLIKPLVQCHRCAGRQRTSRWRQIWTGAGETAEGFAGVSRTVRVGGRRSPSSDGVVTVLRQKGKELFPPAYQEEGPRLGKFMWQNPLSIEVIVYKITLGVYRSGG